MNLEPFILVESCTLFSNNRTSLPFGKSELDTQELLRPGIDQKTKSMMFFFPFEFIQKTRLSWDLVPQVKSSSVWMLICLACCCTWRDNCLSMSKGLKAIFCCLNIQEETLPASDRALRGCNFWACKPFPYDWKEPLIYYETFGVK